MIFTPLELIPKDPNTPIAPAIPPEPGVDAVYAPRPVDVAAAARPHPPPLSVW